MVDWNIEFAHIYADKTFGEEQIESIDILKKKIVNFLQEGTTYSTCILVDEYNPKESVLTVPALLSELSKNNILPHFIGLESKLTAKKDFLLEHIENNKIRKEYEKYIKKHEHIPCSFLVATWYLYRLGHLDLEKGIYRCFQHGNGFQGKKIMNILSKKYEESERKAIKIIKNTEFASCIPNIRTIFY